MCFISENPPGCHAGSEEKTGRLDERINYIKAMHTGCKYLAIAGLSVGAASFFAAWTALRDLKAVHAEILELKSKSRELLRRCEDCERECASSRHIIYQARRGSSRR